MEHAPVLLKESIDALDVRPDGIYVDCTFGRGGHSKKILEQLTTGRLIALDRDVVAIRASEPLSRIYGSRFTAVHSEFSRIKDVLSQLGILSVDGVLFDLGVSSPQLDETERGFSYNLDAPLDMRMDQTQSLTAYDVVNDSDYEQLKQILYDFGEERYAPLIAKAIVRAREQKAIERTSELARIIKKALPAHALREKQHPAKRSFQAIRIAVNSELHLLREGLASAIDLLAPGGKIAVITFHSLEDRIVKNMFKEAGTGCICPKSLPVCVCGRVPVLSVTGKPVTPGEEEIAGNPRSRSARLRVAKKL